MKTLYIVVSNLGKRLNEFHLFVLLIYVFTIYLLIEYKETILEIIKLLLNK